MKRYLFSTFITLPLNVAIVCSISAAMDSLPRASLRSAASIANCVILSFLLSHPPNFIPMCASHGVGQSPRFDLDPRLLGDGIQTVTLADVDKRPPSPQSPQVLRHAPTLGHG